MKKHILYLLILSFFGACKENKNYYMDLGNEKERIYIIPDSIKQFAFFTLDKSKILLQVDDSSSNKLLLDVKSRAITTLNLTAKGFKGIYNNNYAINHNAQQFWQNKNTEIEVYNKSNDRFYYFPNTHFDEIVFLKNKTIFTTSKGLKIFDNQQLTLDSVKNVPPWKLLIEKENEESIYINNDHRYNVKTGVLSQLSREEVRNRMYACFSSESKFRKEAREKRIEILDYYNTLEDLNNKLMTYFHDSKNHYTLYKGKIVIINKSSYQKSDNISNKPLIQNNSNLEKNTIEFHDNKKGSQSAYLLNAFIDFQHEIEDKSPKDILSKYKVYQICTKANKERFGNVYQYVQNPFDFDEYTYSTVEILELEKLMKSGKCPKEFRQDAYHELYSYFLREYNFEKAMFYYNIYKKGILNDKHSQTIAMMKLVEKEFQRFRKDKLQPDIILYEKIKLAQKIDIDENFYETAKNFRTFQWNTCQKILKQYPNSIYADDIELAIFNNKIFKNEEDEYNKVFTKRDIARLRKIIAKYPNSSLKKEFEYAMINTYRCLWIEDATNPKDSIEIFNYKLKGAEMLVDFYIKNPNFYSCNDNEYKEDWETKQLIYAKHDLASLKFEKNIRVLLSSPKAEYNRNEPIIINYAIKNVGKEQQEIETNEIDGLAHLELSFNVLNYPTEGCAADSVIYFQRILQETPKPTKRILNPGEVMNIQIDITKLANLRAKEFSEFENPLAYCYYPNSYGKLQFLKPQTLEIYMDRYLMLTPTNKLLINVK